MNLVNKLMLLATVICGTAFADLYHAPNPAQNVILTYQIENDTGYTFDACVSEDRFPEPRKFFKEHDYSGTDTTIIGTVIITPPPGKELYRTIDIGFGLHTSCGTKNKLNEPMPILTYSLMQSSGVFARKRIPLKCVGITSIGIKFRK